jgi:hypothetical protein
MHVVLLVDFYCNFYRIICFNTCGAEEPILGRNLLKNGYSAPQVFTDLLKKRSLRKLAPPPSRGRLGGGWVSLHREINIAI